MRAGISANSVTRVSGSSAPERAVAARPGGPAGPAGPPGPGSPRRPRFASGRPPDPAQPDPAHRPDRAHPPDPAHRPGRARPQDRRAPPHRPDRAHLPDRRSPCGPAGTALTGRAGLPAPPHRPGRARPPDPARPPAPGSPAGPASPCRPAGPREPRGPRSPAAGPRSGAAPVPRWRARDVPVRRVAARGAGRLLPDAAPFAAAAEGPPAVPLPFGDSVGAAVSGAGSVMVLLDRAVLRVLPVQDQYHQCGQQSRHQQRSEAAQAAGEQGDHPGPRTPDPAADV